MSKKKSKLQPASEVPELLIEVIRDESIPKPTYRFGWLGYLLAKVCIQFTRWLADKVFGAFANWVEKKLKK